MYCIRTIERALSHMVYNGALVTRCKSSEGGSFSPGIVIRKSNNNESVILPVFLTLTQRRIWENTGRVIVQFALPLILENDYACLIASDVGSTVPHQILIFNESAKSFAGLEESTVALFPIIVGLRSPSSGQISNIETIYNSWDGTRPSAIARSERSAVVLALLNSPVLDISTLRF